VISRQTPIGCKASLRKPYKYSPEIVSAQVDFRASRAEQLLRNLGVPESHIREVRAGKMPLTLDWPAPATGDVIEKRVINGQKVKAGDELYRIADHSHLWVIADVAEADLPAIKMGTHATVMVRAYMAQPIQGEVTFIYPELRAETRTSADRDAGRPKRQDASLFFAPRHLFTNDPRMRLAPGS
jgi:hypothetical protein